MSVEVERRGHLLVMGMRRPQKMNASSRDMYRSLARARSIDSSTTLNSGSA